MDDPRCPACGVGESLEDTGRCATCIEAELDRAADVVREVFGQDHVEEIEEP